MLVILRVKGLFPKCINRQQHFGLSWNPDDNFNVFIIQKNSQLVWPFVNLLSLTAENESKASKLKLNILNKCDYQSSQDAGKYLRELQKSLTNPANVGLILSEGMKRTRRYKHCQCQLPIAIFSCVVVLFCVYNSFNRLYLLTKNQGCWVEVRTVSN